MKIIAFTLLALTLALPTHAGGSAFLELSNSEWFGQLVGAAVSAAPFRVSAAIGPDNVAQMGADLYATGGQAYAGVGVVRNFGPNPKTLQPVYDKTGKPIGAFWYTPMQASNSAVVFAGARSHAQTSGFIELRASFGDENTIGARFGVGF